MWGLIRLPGSWSIKEEEMYQLENSHLKRLALGVYWQHLLETKRMQGMEEFAREEVSGAWVRRVVDISCF
jgi:hypothetical protein